MTRRLSHRVISGLACLILLGSFAVPEVERGPASPIKSQLRVSQRFAAGLEYLLVEPRDVEPDAELPMVVFLHGRGDRPVAPQTAFLDLDTPIRLILPRAPEPYGDGYAWMPVSAHDGESPALVAATEARVETLTRALTEWRRRHPTRGRPIVMGFSQGGILSAVLALRDPSGVGHAFPMAGWVPPSLAPGPLDPYAPTAPIHALHGADDPILPASRTRAALGRLRAKGYPVVYEEIGGVGHELAPAMIDRLRALVRRALEEQELSSESSGLS